MNQDLQTAIAHHQAGRLCEAESIYRQILAQHPNQPDPLHLLGLIAHQQSRHDAAIDLMQRAVAIKPDWADAWYNLGVALCAAGHLEKGIIAYEKAVAVNPKFPLALNSLGHAHREAGRYHQAIGCYRQALVQRPDYPEAMHHLAVSLQYLGQLPAAISAYHQAIALNPEDAQGYNNLAVALRDHGELEQAMIVCREAIGLSPGSAQAHHNLGLILQDHGRLDEAIDSYNRAISLDPNLAAAHNSLGNALAAAGKLDEAIEACEMATTISPEFAGAHYNLGKALFETGQLDRAIAAFRQAILLQPANSQFGSALLFALYYQPDLDAGAITGEHIKWTRRHAVGLASPVESHHHHRLRVGYVSPDFRFHPVGRFLLPLIEHHNRRDFELFFYSDVARPDATTARFRTLADHWHESARWKHEQLAAQIRADEIDILIDLTGHTTGSRLLTFARTPAPLQISYLGYPGTTGLAAIGYRLTDLLADPPGQIDPLQPENLYRLATTNWCFTAPEPCPPIQPCPMLREGHITFGSLNNFAKITDRMLTVWARLLQAAPDSRLLLKAAALTAGSARERVYQVLRGHNILADRIILLGPQPDYPTHMQVYQQVDIALDTFPYHGTTTTCEALWMGVPVITLAGSTHVSRVGVSLLSQVGLTELIAATIENYIDLAAALARDRDRLAALRATLRDRMRSCPFMDAPQFTADIETAYRRMWDAH